MNTVLREHEELRLEVENMARQQVQKKIPKRKEPDSAATSNDQMRRRIKRAKEIEAKKDGKKL